MVKDGFLAPYQDLALLRASHGDELNYLATTDREFSKIVDELCRAETPDPQGQAVRESLPAWLVRVSPSDGFPPAR